MSSANPQPCPTPTEAEERAIPREVLRLIAELHPVEVWDGRIVPEDASEELAERIRLYEGELLWATGRESGPRWGCSWIPARTPVPVFPLKRRRRNRPRRSA
jgi:hypothetical protein